ncbi:5'-methylthioadenosine/adenosylhomocysteine nucleosidase [Carnobacteriaceae bacterium zg-ZUI78]|uniref:5'-methylthioadenosine/adenosylhomocysteine nucleosidase n=1 Tax=Granulicatella sp. zg-84 TaxID=2678503 RepID=UPI0013C00DB4|nr:5'-methylthioadenosine/adenosylhomocysteine nucleosidase [Granulicatella sp. zg-84]MBS4750734.1 5'-methylthioadenosine/adenosylhomocysteine nucleosidase [Carnobacteriaceae bacterium zg-ZUI78]NEW66472.1 5'-methylthioadenosine/adenosylhomocysteine nucleosidase [Granulicatella sp. zg-84]QMI86015.1 5'-methylthioadenosine/adenosylhomocysteine nucleosidase [Carnobacteriaceae bacterium zg-84]
MKIGIIGAMAQETVLLKTKMSDIVEKQCYHLTFITGRLYQHDIVLVQSGIGKVNSTIATTLLISQFDVDYVINTGSAGSLKKGLSIGDVVVSNQVAYHDADATVFGYKVGQIPQMPLYYKANEQLMAHAQKAIEKVSLRANVGEIVSADTFVAAPESIARIQKYFPDALCTEMEGASIAQTCHVLGVPFVVVRAISDNADNEAPVSFDEFIVTAGEKSAQMVLAMLEDM